MNVEVLRRPLGLFLLLSTVALPGLARAASLSGIIRDAAGAPIQGMQVRLWTSDTKNWTVSTTVLTDAAGAYAFTGLAAGSYLLDARMPPGYTGNYGDRWYDAVDPIGDGYIGEDADVLVLADTDDLTGYDITLETFGGLDGRVLDETGTPFTGALVRAEWKSDPRYYHDDRTAGPCCGTNPHWGRFYLRGLPPADYRFIVYDPNGYNATLVVPGPFTVTSNANGDAGDMTLAPLPPDPLEPNDGPAAANAASVDMAAVRGGTPWSSTDASIYPKGDVDWYCLTAESGDRLLADVKTTIDVEGTQRPQPWLDPVVSFWSGDGATKIGENDDFGGSYESHLDTGEIVQPGSYCFAVSTYGDTAWDGTNQQTAGAYAITVTMGNRRPSLTLSRDGAPAPQPPEQITIDEGTTLLLDLAFSDPDGDALVPTVEHLNAAGDALTDGVLSLAAESGTYTWAASQIAAQGSPYTLTFTASDGELEAQVQVIVVVNGVNLPPTTPVPVSPADAEVVHSATPTLVVANSTDPDADALTYEFELYDSAASLVPDQTGSVAEDASGRTSWTTAAIPENSPALWRVRAFDGNADNGHSPWSDFMHMRIDVLNDPPAAPVLMKPEDGQVVLTRRPTISATNPFDPEGQAVKLHMEVAADADFTQVVDESPALDPAPGTTTAWTVTKDLDFDGAYFARAFATDPDGAQSDYSNVNGFRIKPNALPPTPSLGGLFASGCTDQSFDAAPESFVVESDPDPDGTAVSIQLQVFRYEDVPESAHPLVNQTLPRDASGETTFTVDSTLFEGGSRYRVRTRTSDGTTWTDWTECDFTLAASQDGADGGIDGGGGGGAGADGGAASGAAAGCGCAATGNAGLVPSLALLLVVLARRRRRPDAE